MYIYYEKPLNIRSETRVYLREGVVYCESLNMAPGLYSSAYYTKHSGRLRNQDLNERRGGGREGGRGEREEGELNHLVVRL